MTPKFAPTNQAGPNQTPHNTPVAIADELITDLFKSGIFDRILHMPPSFVALPSFVECSVEHVYQISS